METAATKQKPPRKFTSIPQRPFYIGLTFSLAGAMVFFLTSSLWIHTTANAAHTPVGTTEKIGTSTVTLKSWRFNPLDNSMLIDFGTKDFNVQNEVSYTLGIYDDNREPIPAEIAYYTTSVLMLKIEEVPTTSHITVTITLKEVSPNTGENKGGQTSQSLTCSFVGVLSEIDVDDALQVTVSDKEYALLDMLYDIDLYERQIVELQSSISRHAQIIETATTKIDTLRTEMEYMTEDELAAANEQIEALKKSVQSSRTSAANDNDAIQDIEAKIKAKQRIVGAFRMENGL